MGEGKASRPESKASRPESKVSRLKKKTSRLKSKMSRLKKRTSRLKSVSFWRTDWGFKSKGGCLNAKWGFATCLLPTTINLCYTMHLKKEK